MANYNKGANFERELIREFFLRGISSVRTAGSHGVFDIHAWILTPRMREHYLYIQCKAGKSFIPQISAENILNDLAAVLPPRAHKFIVEKKTKRNNTTYRITHDFLIRKSSMYASDRSMLGIARPEFSQLSDVVDYIYDYLRQY